MILRKIKKALLFMLMMGGATNLLHAPGDGVPPEAIGVFAIPLLVHNITEEVAKLQALIQLLTVAPTPREMIAPDGTMRDVAGDEEGKPTVVKLSEVSGNDARDGGLPATYLPLQLNAVLEGRIKQLDDLCKKRLEQALDGVKPVVDLVADLKWYTAQAVKIVGVSVALYLAYKCYSSWRRGKKARIAQITKCFSLAFQEKMPLLAKVNLKVLAMTPFSKKITALAGRFTQERGGFFVLSGSQETITAGLVVLSKSTTLAFVPAHILKESFIDHTMQKDVVTAMRALKEENIALVVLDANGVLSDAALMNWIQLSFKSNKVVFASADDGCQKPSGHMPSSFVTVSLSPVSA